MAKKKATKRTTRRSSKPAAEATESRGPGRPATLTPELQATLTAFPGKITAEALEILKELRDSRPNHLGLSHNSLAAELHRVLVAARGRATASKSRRRAPRAAEVEPLQAPAEAEA